MRTTSKVSVFLTLFVWTINPVSFTCCELNLSIKSSYMSSHFPPFEELQTLHDGMLIQGCKLSRSQIFSPLHGSEPETFVHSVISVIPERSLLFSLEDWVMLNKIILKCHKRKKKLSMNHSQYYMYLQNWLDEISFHGDFNNMSAGVIRMWTSLSVLTYCSMCVCGKVWNI